MNDLIAAREAAAETTRERALAQGLARLGGTRHPRDRYDWPRRTLVELVRAARLAPVIEGPAARPEPLRGLTGRLL